MKKKLTKPIYLPLILALLLTITFTSCEKETTLDSKYADAEYLELEKYKFEKLKNNDFEKIIKGYERLETIKNSGKYKIGKNTSEELNMSTKFIYFLVQGLSFENSNLKTKKSILRLKSGDPEDDDDQQQEDPYCFSHSVAALGKHKLKDVKKKSDEKFGEGKGVPIDKAEEFFKEFYPNGKTISLNDFSSSNRDMSGTIVILADYSNGRAHAVNGAAYFGEINRIAYNDAQSGDQGFADTQYVVQILKP